ncbi:hypothetical protein FWC31_03330 [Candidatus Saccharibacteria bacterium]|nr:hypothetical protein [Candidatus Saccharibacteria bacterium]
MRKKRRLLFFIVNLIAISAVAVGAFLPWWQGLRPSNVALIDILPLDFLDNLGFSLNVIAAIFVGAIVVLLGAFLALKPIVLIGVIVNLTTVTLWFLKFNIGWRPNEFGYGIYCLAVGILLSVISIFIPKRRKDQKK